MHYRPINANGELLISSCVDCKVLHCDQEMPLDIILERTISKQLAARFVNQMIAAAYEISGERLLIRDRGVVKVNRPRQISMYLMNTVLSFKFTEIAEFYDKDRTTVSHACGVIEELRDNPRFDRRMCEFENTINSALQLITGRMTGQHNADIK